MGVFGIEAGVFSPFGNDFQNSFKIGGVAEYFFSDIITVRGFGGALTPMEFSRDGGLTEVNTGYYAGGGLILVCWRKPGVGRVCEICRTKRLFFGL